MIYADPMQILAPLYGNFTDLRQFIADATLPALPNGLDDFDKMNLIGSGYMIDREKLLAIPYDAPTMILVYRSDIFENPTYKDAVSEREGVRLDTGSGHHLGAVPRDRRVDQRKVADGTITEQVAGTGHQAKQYDSLMCDFSNVLLASGGDYFDNPDYATWGTSTPGGAALETPEAEAAAKLYKSILDQAAPGQLELGLERARGSDRGRQRRHGAAVARVRLDVRGRHAVDGGGKGEVGAVAERSGREQEPVGRYGPGREQLLLAGSAAGRLDVHQLGHQPRDSEAAPHGGVDTDATSVYSGSRSAAVDRGGHEPAGRGAAAGPGRLEARTHRAGTRKDHHLGAGRRGHLHQSLEDADQRHDAGAGDDGRHGRDQQINHWPPEGA